MQNDELWAGVRTSIPHKSRTLADAKREVERAGGENGMDGVESGPFSGAERAVQEVDVPAGKGRGEWPPPHTGSSVAEDKDEARSIFERVVGSMRPPPSVGGHALLAHERGGVKQGGFQLLHENLNEVRKAGRRPPQGRQGRGGALPAAAIPIPLQGLAIGDAGETRDVGGGPEFECAWKTGPLGRKQERKLWENLLDNAAIRDGARRAAAALPDRKR